MRNGINLDNLFTCSSFGGTTRLFRAQKSLIKISIASTGHGAVEGGDSNKIREIEAAGEVMNLLAAGRNEIFKTGRLIEDRNRPRTQKDQKRRVKSVCTAAAPFSKSALNCPLQQATPTRPQRLALWLHDAFSSRPINYWTLTSFPF